MNAYACITEDTLNEVGDALIKFRNWLDSPEPWLTIQPDIDSAIQSYLAYLELLQSP